MLQGLLIKFPAEFRDHCFLDFIHHFRGIPMAAAGHDLHHLLKHEKIFHFRHIRHHHSLPAEIIHFGVGAPVAIDHSPALEMMHRLKVVEGASGLDHFVA